MGDLVNLNKARKAKAKGAARALAEANRAKFGRTRVEKDIEKARRAKAEHMLDGAKIEKD